MIFNDSGKEMENITFLELMIIRQTDKKRERKKKVFPSQLKISHFPKDFDLSEEKKFFSPDHHVN